MDAHTALIPASAADKRNRIPNPRPDEEPNDVTEQHETPTGVSGNALRSNAQPKDIPPATVTRLATYLRVLAVLADEGVVIVSSEELAVAAGVGSAKLRKDLSFLGPNGVRGVGYDVAKLRARIEDVLGLSQGHRVILIGAGNLGRALAGYRGFRRRGFTMVGIFDQDPEVIGETVSGLAVRDVAELHDAVAELAPTIAVITVPDAAAQQVCDQLVDAGMRCILSFSPVALDAPSSVEVRRVDLAVEMQMLSFEGARSAEAGIAAENQPDAVMGEAGDPMHTVPAPIVRRPASAAIRKTGAATHTTGVAVSALEPSGKGSVVTQ